MEVVGEFYSSPGMVSESFTLLRAHGLEPGWPRRRNGGRGHHRAPRAGADLAGFIAPGANSGHAIDVSC
jgi:ADP-ribose pyrophosphatase